MHRVARGEIPEPASSPPSPVGDGSPGTAGEQSGGLTHWDRFKSQCNLTLSGRATRTGVRLMSGWVTASQIFM